MPRSDPFFVEGKLKLSNSACVLCLRQRKRAPELINKASFLKMSTLDEEKAFKNFEKSPFVGNMVAQGDMKFINNWEILMGQNEVINYLKSTPNKLKTMSFAGEFKVAGGHVDEPETIEAAAKRELKEEYLIPGGVHISDDLIRLRPFSVKQTRPIRSKASLMHNFVCLEEENDFLKNLDIDSVNRKLKAKRKKFRSMVLDGTYWSLSKSEKEKISPEVHSLQWMPLSLSILYSLSSFVPGIFVNKWQKDQFDFLSNSNKDGKTKRRDPMMITAVSIVEIEPFQSSEALIKYCSSVNIDELRKDGQWLFNGMTNDEVVSATAERFKTKFDPRVLYPEHIEKQRTVISKL